MSSEQSSGMQSDVITVLFHCICDDVWGVSSKHDSPDLQLNWQISLF